MADKAFAKQALTMDANMDSMLIASIKSSPWVLERPTYNCNCFFLDTYTCMYVVHLRPCGLLIVVLKSFFRIWSGFDNHGQDCIVIGNMTFEISEYAINIAVDHLKCNSSFYMGEHLNADQERSFDNKEASTSARLFHLSLLKKTSL